MVRLKYIERQTETTQFFCCAKAQGVKMCLRCDLKMSRVGVGFIWEQSSFCRKTGSRLLLSLDFGTWSSWSADLGAFDGVFSSSRSVSWHQLI